MLRSFLNGTVFGVEHGGGRPWLLALHGWQRSHADFDAALGARAEGDDPFAGAEVPSVAVDLPGFGASPPPPAAWNAERYAAEIAGLLDDFGEPVVVLGHSFGGRVAIWLALTQPERVRALVLCGVPLREPRIEQPPKARFGYRLIRSAASLGLVGEERLEAARRRYGSRDYREAEGVMRGVLVATLAGDQRTWEALPDLAVPVGMIWGDLDTAAPLASARAAAARIGTTDLEVVPGIGHLVPTEAPRILRAALAKWAP